MLATEKRLIDANALSKDAFHIKQYGKGIRCVVDWDDIKAAPTVDAVEVVHGEWVGIQYDGYADGCPVYDLWECSNCREEYESEGDPPPYNYCPNCGAKMDGDGNG